MAEAVAETQFELCMDEYDDDLCSGGEAYRPSAYKLHQRFEQIEMSEETGPGTAARQVSPDCNIVMNSSQ